MYAQWEVMRLAKEHDTIVLLDGQGADELLGGYATAYGMYWSHLLYRGQLVRLGRAASAYSRRYGFSSVTALYVGAAHRRCVGANIDGRFRSVRQVLIERKVGVRRRRNRCRAGGIGAKKQKGGKVNDNHQGKGGGTEVHRASRDAELRYVARRGLLRPCRSILVGQRCPRK